MDENRVSGTAKNLAGKVEEGFGRATGDAKTRAQGQARQVEGSIQDLYGKAVDSAGDTIEAVKQMPGSVDELDPPLYRNQSLHDRRHRARHRLADRKIAPPLLMRWRKSPARKSGLRLCAER